MPPARKQQPRTLDSQVSNRLAWLCDCTYEKNVGQDTAQHASLDNADFALLERNDGDLRCVSGCGGACGVDARADLQ